jgi:hypothetical protein
MSDGVIFCRFVCLNIPYNSFVTPAYVVGMTENITEKTN